MLTTGEFIMNPIGIHLPCIDEITPSTRRIFRIYYCWACSHLAASRISSLVIAWPMLDLNVERLK